MPKRMVGGLIVVLVMAFAAHGFQTLSRLHSNPNPPPREALDRLNLNTSWRAYIPTDGRKDGFLSIQLHDKHLIAQTRSGLIALLDAETGRTVWRTRLGLPYQQALPLAFNYSTIFVVNGTNLHALDRETGTQRWHFNLPAGLSAPPVADERQIYLCAANSRLYAYRLPLVLPGETPSKSDYSPPTIDPSKRPTPEEMARKSASPALTYFTSVRQSGSELGSGPQPLLNWSVVTRLRIELAPVYSKNTLFVCSPENTYFAIDKAPEGRPVPLEPYRLNTDGPINVPPGSFDETAYVGSADDNLYAINIDTGRMLWRFTAGSPITREPAATQADVFTTSQRGGLARINRDTGEPAWRIARGDRSLPSNTEADRFLASNPKFVYATDRSGRLLVLDRGRGTKLSSYDLREFAFPVVNVVTDRLYLAANNGLIVCLHDKEYREPVRHRQLVEDKQNPTLALKDALLQSVTMKEGENKRTVRDLLQELGKRHGLEFDFGNKAFRAEKIEPAADQEIFSPRADNIPLQEHLKNILDKVEARFEIVGGIIFVLPKKQAAKPAAAEEK